MKDLLVICLHGFLGTGEDWDPLKSLIKEALFDKDIEFWCPSLLTGNSQLGPENSFEEWPQKFVNEINLFEFKKCILIGYSMGGRLALNALAHYPDKFDAVVFLSTNPSLLSAETLEARKKQDLEWVKKFLNQDWSSLMKDWNQQAVFSSETTHPERSEEDFSRKSLALAMQNWSVVHHQMSLSELSEIKTPSLWVAGENDHKFVAILKNLQTKGLPAEFLILPNCGHRIRVENYPILMEKLVPFMEKAAQ